MGQCHESFGHLFFKNLSTPLRLPNHNLIWFPIISSVVKMQGVLERFQAWNLMFFLNSFWYFFVSLILDMPSRLNLSGFVDWEKCSSHILTIHNPNDFSDWYKTRLFQGVLYNIRLELKANDISVYTVRFLNLFSYTVQVLYSVQSLCNW